MIRIRQVVRQARMRMALAALGRSLCYTFSAASLLSVCFILSAHFWDWGSNLYGWRDVFLVATFGVALSISLIYTWWRNPSEVSVAQEVDRRFHLKERLSTALLLLNEASDSLIASAQISETEQSAREISIADQFELKPNRIFYLPCCLLPALFMSYSLVEPSRQRVELTSLTESIQEDQKVAESVKVLRKQIQERKKAATAKGLSEALDLYSRLEQKLDRLESKPRNDQKQTMIAMNDLKQQLEDRVAQLGSSDAIKKSLSPLQGLPTGEGQKMLDAMKSGDFRKAGELINEYKKQLESGDITDQQRQALKAQLESLKNSLGQTVQNLGDQQKELQGKIQAAKQSGNQSELAELQDKLDQLQSQSDQMQALSDLAQSLDEASKALNGENLQSASDALSQLAENLQQLERESDELQDLQSALSDISMSKNAMRCQSCAGNGCSECGGNGVGNQQMSAGQGSSLAKGMGDGFGAGSGKGDRPESETGTNTYQTKVRGKLSAGSAVLSGVADGPNRKGVSRETLQQAIDVSLQQQGSPTENQLLPKAEREHAMQYFNQLRDGK